MFDVEPLPLDHPFRKIDNVVITPHLGYVSQQNYERYYPDIVENIRGFLDGKSVRVIAPENVETGHRLPRQGQCDEVQATVGHAD